MPSSPYPSTSNTGADLISTAPGSDTGQTGIAVRVISQLGAGSGGGGGNLATAAKGTTAAGSPTSTATDANTQSLHSYVVNFPTTQAVSGTFWQATQPVSGTFWQATQPVSIASMPSTPVTGTFWQATQPVSNTQLPAALAAGGGLKVEGIAGGVAQPVSIASMPTTPVTGTFFQATQPVSAAALPLPSGAATDTTVAAISTTLTAGTVQLAAGSSVGATPSVRGLQVVGSDYGGTPLARVPKVDSSGFQYIGNFPASQAVTGTFFQATQPVSLAANTPDVTDRSGRLLGTIANTSFAATQGTAAAVAGAWPMKITDGTSVAAVKAASTAALAADPAVVIAMHPLSPAYFKASDVVGTALSAANTTATLTLAAGGAGLFLYITRIRVTLHNTSATAVAGSAVALAFTTTNMPGTLAWTAGNALAAGTDKTVVDEYLDSPIKTSTANTATTIVLPACGAGVQSRATIYGYYGA